MENGILLLVFYAEGKHNATYAQRLGGKWKMQLNLPKSCLPVCVVECDSDGTASDGETSLCISRRLWKIGPYCLQKISLFGWWLGWLQMVGNSGTMFAT